MQCSNCGHLNSDDAAFCSACGTRLGRACPNCSAPYEPGAAFCSRCGTPLGTGVPPASGDEELTRYVPAELLEKLHEARQGRAMAGERRMVTMLFADVTGSTAAAEQLDPEEWADIMNGAFDRLIRPVYRYEGTLARLMGDAILAFFGAPIAHEDDPERAVRAGLAMLRDAGPYGREVRERWGVDFDLRVGINTGLVVVGEVGSDLRVEYSALGDAVNVAARMEQTARPGTLQITEDTHRLVETLFEFEELEPVSVKGKSNPVQAYRVIGERRQPDAARGQRGKGSRLIGRDVELESLHRVADDVREGKGRACAIIGEAGVGKTRLVEALRAELAAIDCLAPWRAGEEPGPERIRWLEARCVSYDTTVAYAPFVDLFTRLFEIETDDAEGRDRVAEAVQRVSPEGAGHIVPYLCVILGIEPGGSEGLVVADLPAPALQRRVFRAVVDYFEACTRVSPGLLVFEDLHWADSISLALLEEILSATDRSMLGLITLMRPYRDDASWSFHESAQRSHSHRYESISLEPLGDKACRQMLVGLLGAGDLPEVLEDAVLEKADGNPFFVEEIVRALIESGTLVKRGEAWSLEQRADGISIPSSVSGLLTARLDRLDGTSKLVAQLASVIGREFVFDELSALVGDMGSTDSAVADLMRRELVVERRRVPEREYAFRHALIQEAAYSTILLKNRRSLHAQVAEHLISGQADEPQEIARHLLESKQEERAVPFLIEAGDRAARSMSLADAIRLYDQALTFAGEGTDPELVSRAHNGMGAAYSLIPDLTKASASYQRLLDYGRERSEPSMQIAALNRLGATSAFLGGDYDAATAYLEDARRLAEEVGDEMGLAEYHMNSCMIATTRGDMDEAAAHDAETVRLGESLGAAGVHAGGLVQRALSLLHGARFEEGRRALEQARSVLEGSDNPTVAASLDAAEYFLLLRDGRLEEAWESMRRAADVASRVGSSTASVLSLQAGGAAALRGDFENGLAFYGKSLRLGEELGQAFNCAAAAASMVRIYAELGVAGDKPTSLREAAIGYLEAPMGETLVSTVHAELGWAALELGHLDAAAEAFGRGLAGTSASKRLELPSLQLGLATTRVLAGDSAGAAPLVAEAVAFVDERDMSFYRPATAGVQGAVALAEGRPEEATEILTVAVRRAEDMGLGRLEWKLRAARSRALAASGRANEAAKELNAAGDAAAALADRLVDESMRVSFLRVTKARLAQLSGATVS